MSYFLVIAGGVATGVMIDRYHVQILSWLKTQVSALWAAFRSKLP